MDDNLQHPDIEVLVRYLKKALRQGCRASRLLTVPELLELLYPSERYPGMDELEKAVRVEERLRLAAECFGGDWAAAALTLLGLLTGSHGQRLGRRREMAARLISGDGATMQSETFRRHHEHTMLCDIVCVLIAITTQSEDDAGSV